MRHTTALFIFRRDLRLEDNQALLAACQEAEVVVPIFVFDPRQVGTANDYKSNNSIEFMCASLEDLDEQLKKKGGKLYCFSGIAEKLIPSIAVDIQATAVFFGADYTPFARARDEALTQALTNKNIAVHSIHDTLLMGDPAGLLNQSGTPYTVFTPFFKAASSTFKSHEAPAARAHFFKGTLKDSVLLAQMTRALVTQPNKQLAVQGGSTQGHTILKRLGNFKQYPQTRDIPAISTTHLSAHLKFGTVSARQVVAAVRATESSHHLVRQLYWRDFYTYIAFHFPYVFGKSFNKKYQSVAWSHNKEQFERWCAGTTGFPLVDAGMRQLNATGYMHNRVRMVVCSFLTKNLHIPWLWGERYFAQQLVDYDPAVNNGNWQWGASTGADAAPYFRVFNPWLQQKKFDPACVYIKTWVPELKNISSNAIHAAYKAESPLAPHYPLPMVDHAVTAAQAKELFKNLPAGAR